MVYDRIVDRPGPQTRGIAPITDSHLELAQRISQARRRGKRAGAVAAWALLASANVWMATGDVYLSSFGCVTLLAAEMIWLGFWLSLSSLRVTRRVPLAMVSYAILLVVWSWLYSNTLDQLLILSLAAAIWGFVVAGGLRLAGFTFHSANASREFAPRAQFSLASLLAWTALAAGVLALYRYESGHPETVLVAQWQWMWEPPRAAYWATAALLSLAVTSSLLGTAHPRRRVTVGICALLVAMAVPFDAWLGITTASFLNGTWWNPYRMRNWEERLGVTTILATIAWIALGVRWWGYRLVRHPRHRSKLPPATEIA